MKKSGLLVVITVLVLVTAVILAGCTPTQQITGIDVKNPKIVFNLNEEFQIGTDAEYSSISGTKKTSISAADIEYETAYDKTKEGIYEVTVYYQNKEFSYKYKVVVLDYSTLTAEKGSLLGSISFNQSLCLSWKDGTTVLDSAGTINCTAIFQPGGSSATEVTLPVTVTDSTLPQKQNNEWTAELTIENWTYGESPSVPSASAKSGTVEFTYYKNNNGTKGDRLENAPTDAGSYIVVASVAESEEYNALSAEKTFVINKATLSISANTSLTKYQNIRKYYDGSYALDSVSFFTAADYYILSCATVSDLSGIIVTAVGNGTFVNKTTNEPDKNIGEKYVLQSVEINSANFVNFAFSDGNQYTNISFEGLIEKGEPATIETNPVSSAVLQNDALSKSSISGGKVTYSLCAQEDSTAATSTELNGVWSWQNPETVLTQSGLHTARFTPTDTNIDPVTVNIFVELLIHDNSQVKISIEEEDEFQAEREGNNFSYEVPFDTSTDKTLFIELILSGNTNFVNYKLYLGNDLNAENATNEKIGISINDIKGNSARVEFTISGENFSERVLTLTLTFQQLVTFTVNGEKLNNDTVLNVGDVINITKLDATHTLYLNNQNPENEILNGVTSGTYTVEEKDIGNTLYFYICYTDGQIADYMFRVENLFSSVKVNDTIFDTDESTSYYTLSENETTITLTFQNPTITNYSLNLTLKNIYGKNRYISIGNATIYTIDISEIQEINIYNNSENVYFDFYLCLNNFTYIEEIYATANESPVEERNGILQPGNNFIENIYVTLKDGYSDYRYEITDENGNAFDLKNVKMINKFLVKIYSGADESSLVETKEYIIEYDFVLQTDNSSYVYTDYADEMFPMYFFESENDTEDVTFTLLDNEFKNYTLEFLNEDGELLSPQTMNIIKGRNSYIVRIISGEYKFEDRLELFFFSSSPHNFISNITYNFIVNSESNNNDIFINEIYYYTVYIPVIHSIDYFVSLLNYEYILDGYTANATYLSELECVYIEIKDSNDSVVSGLLIHIEFEGIANDDISFTASRLNNISLESTPIEKDSSDIYVVSNILSSEQIFIDTANPYILIELYKNSVATENLLAKYYGSASISSSDVLSEMIDGIYMIKITSTDLSNSVTITLNITFDVEPFLSVTINDNSFNVIMQNNIPVADSDNWELELSFGESIQTFIAHINSTLLPAGDTVTATLVPMSGFSIKDFSDNSITSGIAHTFEILTETDTEKKYFRFKMVTGEYEMYVYVYFDFEPLITLTVENNEFTAVMNQYDMSFNTSENWNIVFDNEREMIVANLPAALISADDTEFTVNINLKDGYTLSDTEGAALTEGENTFEIKTDSDLKKYIEFSITYMEMPVTVNIYFDFA